MAQRRSNRTYRGSSDGNIALAAVVAVVTLILIVLVFLSTGFCSRQDEGAQEQSTGQEATTATTGDEQSEEDAQAAAREDTARYPEADRLRINGGIAEAEQAAKSKNYASALATIKTLLEDYPDSLELQSKYDEYAKLLTEESAAAAQAEAEAEKAAKNKTVYSPDGQVNVRAQPRIDSDVVTIINEGQRVTFDGEIEQGPGASGADRDWYHIIVSDTEQGWVVGDLLVEDTGEASTTQQSTGETTTSEQSAQATGDLSDADLSTNTVLVLVPKTDTVLRVSPTDQSSQVTSLSSGAELYYYGVKNTGVGDDGATHTWCYVQYMNDVFGWVRADKVNIQG